MPRILMQGRAFRERLPMPFIQVFGGKPRYLRAVVPAFPYDFAVDVRELVLEEVRDGLPAMWSDPYERFGIRRGHAR